MQLTKGRILTSSRKLVRVVKKNPTSSDKDADISVFHMFGWMGELVSPEHFKIMHF